MLRLTPVFILLCLGLSLCALWSQRASLQTTLPRRITNTADEKLSINPSLSGDGSHIAFESSADLASTGGDPSFRAFTAGLEPLAFVQMGATRAIAPAMSQDGSIVAFSSKDNPLGTNLDGNSEIFLFSSGLLRQITNTTPDDPSLRHVHGNFQPSLTDNGDVIAFSSNRQLTGQNADANLEIVLFDISTNAFAQLTDSTGIRGASDAKISGDGSRVAYIVDESAIPSIQRDLWLKDLITGESRRLADDVNDLRVTPGRSISDDGLRIIYSAAVSENETEVFLFDGRNHLTRQLTSIGARTVDVALEPTISGDGKRVAFATRRNFLGGNSDNSVELYTLDLPTGNFARVTTAPAAATAGIISSLNDDGSLVAFNFPRILSGQVSSPNLANNSEIYVATTEVRPPFSTNLTILNGASFGHEPASFTAVAPDSIAVAFGDSLAFTTALATPLPGGTFPTIVGGTTVTVNNRAAQIFSVTPTRVVFHVPAETENTFAQLVITNSEGFQTRGTIRVVPAAPGIFTVSGDGLGEGNVLNALTGQPGPFDPTNGTIPLVVYATGARGLPEQISVTIGGRVVPFESIAPSSQTPGLDEIRILLPRDLRGAGLVYLSLRAGHRDSNPVTIIINGDRQRDVYINEVLADPPDGLAGDANHDGVRSGTEDEFIELVNAQTDDVNISGWSLRTRPLSSTTESTRQVFPEGTVIPPRDALVVFGGGAFNFAHPAFGGAQVQRASSSGLSLTNTGLTILLRDAAGNLIAEFSYGGSTGLDGNANQSLARSPDISGNYVLHTQAVGAGGRAFSPGTLVDGTFFVFRTPLLSSINISPAASDCVAGQSVQFIARAFDQFNRPVRHPNISFALTNGNIAMVDSIRIDRRTGVASALLRCLNEGRTEIRATATDGSTILTTSAAHLTVAPAPPVIVRVDVSPQSSIINRGQTQQFQAAAFDADNQEVNGIVFAWSTGNTEIATVDTNGLARATGFGSVVIKATASNGTGGNISGQATLSVKLPLVINEILADVPPDDPATPALEGDANRDGTRNSADDEFIELLNNSDQPVDISGVIIADATSNRYTIPPNTFLADGRALLVFGGGSPPISDPAFGGSLVLRANALGLNDAGDTVHVKLPLPGGEITVATVTFSAGGPIPAPNNQSLTRAPDAEVNQPGGNFVAHLDGPQTAGRVFSPGTRANGTPFGSPSLVRLEISPSSATLNIGQVQVFTCTAFVIQGGSEVELQNVSLIWDSSDANKATVAPQTGRATTATGVAAGTVIVRARAGSLEVGTVLTINPPPQVLTRIEVTPTAAATIVGGTRQFIARAFDQNNIEIPGVVFNWVSSNVSVATINETGLATGISMGVTNITASSGQVTSDPAILNVTVPQIPAADQIIINEALVSFSTGTPPRTDFVELFNTSTQTLDLSGLVISFRASGNTSSVSTITLPGAPGSGTTLISPHGYFLIANGPMTFGVGADFDASVAGFDLNNSSGAVMIQMNAVKLDGLRYQQNGSGAPPVAFDHFGEGALFTFAGGTPNDLVRSPNGADTNNNATDFRRNNSHTTVSPRAPNPTIP